MSLSVQVIPSSALTIFFFRSSSASVLSLWKLIALAELFVDDPGDTSLEKLCFLILFATLGVRKYTSNIGDSFLFFLQRGFLWFCAGWWF